MIDRVFDIVWGKMSLIGRCLDKLDHATTYSATIPRCYGRVWMEPLKGAAAVRHGCGDHERPVWRHVVRPSGVSCISGTVSGFFIDRPQDFAFLFKLERHVSS